MAEPTSTTTNGNHKQGIHNIAIRQPLRIEETFDGIIHSSLQMAEETYNGECDLRTSKVAQGHITNSLAAIRSEATILSRIEKTRNPVIARALASRLRPDLALQVVKALALPSPDKPAEESH